MSRLEELVDGPGRYNSIASVGVDGLTLFAERIIIDDPNSAWKLTKKDQNGQIVYDNPSFADVYTNAQLYALAKFGGYTDWKPIPIEYKQGYTLVDGEDYMEQRIPKY